MKKALIVSRRVKRRKLAGVFVHIFMAERISKGRNPKMGMYKFIPLSPNIARPLTTLKLNLGECRLAKLRDMRGIKKTISANPELIMPKDASGRLINRKYSLLSVSTMWMKVIVCMISDKCQSDAINVVLRSKVP
jgi:hypothetical protein